MFAVSIASNYLKIWPTTGPSPEMIAVFSGIFGCLGTLGSLCLLLSYWVFHRFRSDHQKILCFISLCDLGLGLQYGLILLHFCHWLRPMLRLAPLLGHASYAPSCVWAFAQATHVCATLHLAELNGGSAKRSFFAFKTTMGVSVAFPFSLLAATVVHAAIDPSLPTIVAWPLSDMSIPRLCVSATIADVPPLPQLVPWLLRERAFGKTGALAYFTIALICCGTQGFMYAASLRCIARNKENWEYQPLLRVVKLRAQFVPVVFVVTRGPGLLYLALRVVHGPLEPGWLMFMAAVGEASQGLWNGLMFGYCCSSYFGAIIASPLVFPCPRDSHQPLSCEGTM